MADETNAGEAQNAGFRFRDTTRAPLATTVRLRFDRLGGAVSAESADISMEGMFVKTEEPRPVGTLVQFEFDVVEPSDEGLDGGGDSTPSPTGEVVQGLGDVVWVRANGGPDKPAGMGIQFRYVDAQSREHVSRIVSDFVRQISGGSVPSLPSDGGERDHGSMGLQRSAQGTLDLGPAGDGLGGGPSDGMAPNAVGPASMGSNVGDLGPGEQAGPSEASGAATKTALLSQLPGWESAADQNKVERRSEVPEMEPPPPAAPASGDVGPFGALLASEPDRRPGFGEHVPDESPPAPAPSALSSSGSFSLSVPNPDRPELDSLPPLSGALDSAPAAADHRTPEAAGKTEDPTLDGPQLDNLDGVLTDLSVEPYSVEPYSEEPDETGSYYSGGSSGLKKGPNWRSLGVLGLLAVALVAGAFFFKPWQYFGGVGEQKNGDSVPSDSGSFDSASSPPAAPADGQVDSLGTAEQPGNDLEEDSLTTPGAGTEEAQSEFVASANQPLMEEPSTGDATGSSSRGPQADSASAQPGAIGEEAKASGRDSRFDETTSDRRVMELVAADLKDRTQVRLATSRDLGQGDYSFLSLSGPPRFVLKIDQTAGPYAVGARSVRFRSVRTGMHTVGGVNQLHLVFDMTSPDFQADVRLDRGELLITFR